MDDVVGQQSQKQVGRASLPQCPFFVSLPSATSTSCQTYMVYMASWASQLMWASGCDGLRGYADRSGTCFEKIELLLVVGMMSSVYYMPGPLSRSLSTRDWSIDVKFEHEIISLLRYWNSVSEDQARIVSHGLGYALHQLPCSAAVNGDASQSRRGR